MCLCWVKCLLVVFISMFISTYGPNNPSRRATMENLYMHWVRVAIGQYEQWTRVPSEHTHCTSLQTNNEFLHFYGTVAIHRTFHRISPNEWIQRFSLTSSTAFITCVTSYSIAYIVWPPDLRKSGCHVTLFWMVSRTPVQNSLSVGRNSSTMCSASRTKKRAEG